MGNVGSIQYTGNNLRELSIIDVNRLNEIRDSINRLLNHRCSGFFLV